MNTEKLRKHSTNQRRELRRMNRSINMIGKAERYATRLDEVMSLRFENNRLRSDLRARHIWITALAICYVMALVAVVLG